MRHPKFTARGQWCEYGDRRFYARSQAEVRHAAMLEVQRKAGAIDDWRHEPRTFVFHGVTRGSVSYTPDFVVTTKGVDAFHEVKGWWDSKSTQKLVLMARHYPDVRIVTFGAPLPQSASERVERTRAKSFRDRDKASRAANLPIGKRR